MSRYTADLIVKIDGRKFITPIVVNVIRDERTMGYIVEPERIRYFMTDEYGAQFVKDEDFAFRIRGIKHEDN